MSPREERPLRRTELDRTSFPEFRERIADYEANATHLEPRSYPGYARVPLERVRPRRLASLDRALTRRRSARALDREVPSRRTLSRLLALAHGITGPDGRGPVPSAGGLQALELYVAVLEPGWLERGAYHYDRTENALARLPSRAARADWERLVPSLASVGGALLWVAVGDAARASAKYGERADRFLLLEAGHLGQNLGLLSVGLGLATTPLGGVLEPDVARELLLPEGDLVLSAGACGKPAGLTL
jgi:SagB-type dehydrogenase family enzyme